MVANSQALVFNPPDLLINRFCNEYNISREEAVETFQETKKFLIICAVNRDGSYSPSQAVDTMWHHFMLYSKDYFSFCELLGGYIHHQPSERREPEKYMNTLEALRSIFGEINQLYWEVSASNCTSCEACHFG
jgi:hypothetical protein